MVDLSVDNKLIHTVFIRAVSLSIWNPVFTKPMLRLVVVVGGWVGGVEKEKELKFVCFQELKFVCFQKGHILGAQAFLKSSPF